MDPKSHPKSKLGFILFMIFLVILLISGSYFGYVYYTKRKEGARVSAAPIRRPTMMPPGAKIGAPIAKIPPTRKFTPEQLRQMNMREMLKKEERAKLFGKFGGAEEKKTGEKLRVKKPEVKKSAIKPIQAEIAKTKEQAKKLPSGQKQDAMERLRKLSEKTSQGKIAKEDVFKELKKIARTKETKKK